ncbi:hypothetical protein [Clostridium perfringens]|nr:hypothetical protein [Clostridium perfringens]
MNKKYFKEVLGNKKTLKNLGINVFIWITLSFLFGFVSISWTQKFELT